MEWFGGQEGVFDQKLKEYPGFQVTGLKPGYWYYLMPEGWALVLGFWRCLAFRLALLEGPFVVG